MLHKLHSNNLYKIDELVSALQKSIRRCEVKEALFWAGELYHSGFENILWSRLQTILSEDIGIAEPQLVLQLPALDHKNITTPISTRAQQERLIEIVYLMASCRKSRLVDNGVGVALFLTQPSENWQLPSVNHPLTQIITQRFQFGGLFQVEDATKLDAKAALIGLVGALEQKSLTDIFFFLRVLSLNDNNFAHISVLQPFLGNLPNSKKNFPNIHIYTWYLLLTHAQQNNTLFEVCKRLCIWYFKGYGEIVLHLYLAAILCTYFEKIDWKTTPISAFSKIPVVVANCFFNPYATIERRRQFKIPSHALDKHTARGRGHNFQTQDTSLLHEEGQKRKIITQLWSIEEIEKSHGAYQRFAAIATKKQHSPISHFFDEGAKLNNLHTNPIQREDAFALKNRNMRLALEKKYGQPQGKSNFIIEKMLPILLKNQQLWKQ